MSTFVYFIQAGGEAGAIKIGYSSDVEKRLAGLQTGNHLRLSLLAKFEHRNAQAIEVALHANFAAQRIEGEWFACCDAILDVIDAWRGISATRDTFVSPRMIRRLERCAVRPLAFDDDVFVVEWSHRQGCFHVDQLNNVLHMNREILLHGRGVPQDYTMLAICASYEEAHGVADAFEPSLRAMRAVRIAMGND